MTDTPPQKPERFVMFDPKPEPRFFVMKDAEARKINLDPGLDDLSCKPRVVYHMDVMDTSGQRMVLQVGPAALDKMRKEAERLARMKAAPWYRRLPLLWARRVRYWIGDLVSDLRAKVRRK